MTFNLKEAVEVVAVVVVSMVVVEELCLVEVVAPGSWRVVVEAAGRRLPTGSEGGSRVGHRLEVGVALPSCFLDIHLLVGQVVSVAMVLVPVAVGSLGTTVVGVPRAEEAGCSCFHLRNCCRHAIRFGYLGSMAVDLQVSAVDLVVL